MPNRKPIRCTCITAFAGAILITMPPGANSEQANPKELGARYGQALGALEICEGTGLTGKARALEASFSGKDLEAYKKSAAEVFDAWRKVRACSNAVDPNSCKIMMDASCFAAFREIGPNGSALPGLIELRKQADDRPKPQ